MQGLVFYGFAIAAVALYALQPIMAKKLQLSIPPFAFIAITMLVLAILALCASLIFEKQFKITQLQSSHVILLVAFGVVNLFSFWFFLKAISGIPTAHYQIIGGTLAPILTALFAFAFIGEGITARFFLAIPLAAAALYIAIFK
jgi:drug/metabolite transporter (DMT)-like permease